MEPHFFATPADFRKWFEMNHENAAELLVGFYKKATGKPSITWPESVDQALCFGWIDGVRRSYDADSYTIRFTPRRPNSIWSTININKMEDLLQKGLVKPMGKAAYAKRTEKNSSIYAYEQQEHDFSETYEALFKKEKAAWQFFEAQPPYYRKQMMHWVMSAKQEKTQLSRLDKLIAASAAGQRIL